MSSSQVGAAGPVAAPRGACSGGTRRPRGPLGAPGCSNREQGAQRWVGQPDVLVQGTLLKVPEETLAASPRPASPGHRCPHLVGRSRPPVQGMPAHLASGAGDPAPTGPLTLQAPGSRAHAQRRAGAILSHRHRRPPLPWSRVCSEQSIAGRCASVPHGGVWHRKRVLSPAQRPPWGAPRGHRTVRTLPFGGRGCSVPRSTSVGVRAPLVKQSRYLGPGQANQSGFCKKSSKMTAGRVYGTARRQFHRIPGMSHRRARCPGRRRPGPGDGAGAAEAGCPRRCSRLSVLQPNSSNDNIQSVTSGDWDVTRILSYDEKQNKM